MNSAKPNLNESTDQTEVSPVKAAWNDDLGQSIHQALVERVNQSGPSDEAWAQIKAGLQASAETAESRRPAAKGSIYLLVPHQAVQTVLALVLLVIGSMYLQIPEVVEPMPQLIANIPAPSETDVFDEYMAVAPPALLDQAEISVPDAALEVQTTVGLNVPLDLPPHPLSNQGRHLNDTPKQPDVPHSTRALSHFDEGIW